MVCSNCGHALGPDDQFCGGCGAYLTDAPEAEDADREPDHLPPPKHEERSGAPAGLIAAAVAVVALVALAILWVLRPDGSVNEASDPETTPATSATAQVTTESATEEPTPTETTPPSPPPRAQIELPSAAQQCSNTGSFVVYRGNSTTSCPFAENVGRAFAALEQPVTSEVTLAGVSSPVTGLDYDLTCAYTSPIRCTGGNDAAIYLVPAS